MRQNASTTCLRVQAHEWAKAQGYDCKELFNLGFYFIHGPSGINIQVFQSDDDGEFFVMQTSVSVGGRVERAALLEQMNAWNAELKTLKFTMQGDDAVQLSLEYILPQYAPIAEVMERYVTILCQGAMHLVMTLGNGLDGKNS